MGPAARRATAQTSLAISGWFAVLVAMLLGVGVFFLVRPLLADGAVYRARPEGSPFAYWYLEAAAFIPYWLTLARARRRPLPPTRVVLAGAAVLYVLLIPAPAQQSQDVYQYLVYGKMAVAGVNPYAATPAETGDPWVVFSLWDDAPTVYGPLWTLATAGIIRLSGGSLLGAFLGVKVLAAALALATAALLVRVRSSSDPGAASLALVAFAYNPLVVFSVGLGAHADIAVAAAFAGAVLWARRGNDVATTLLLSAALLVKLYAAVALVVWLIVLVRRRGGWTAIAHGAVAGAAIAAVSAPFWAGADTLSGISRVRGLASASLGGTVIRALTGLPNDAAAGASLAGSVVRIVGAAILAGAVVRLARSRRTAVEPWRGAALVFAVYVLVTPWYLPWHLLGALALAALISDERLAWSLWAFAGTSLIVASGATVLPAGLAVAGLVLQTVLRYGPPLALYMAWPSVGSHRASDNGP